MVRSEELLKEIGRHIDRIRELDLRLAPMFQDVINERLKLRQLEAIRTIAAQMVELLEKTQGDAA